MTAIVSIFGRLAADAKVSSMQNGGAVFNFRMASNARVKRDGQWGDVATWWSVTLFVSDRQVDYFSGCLVKGAQVFVSGPTHQETYINREGQEKSSMAVVANVVNPVQTGQSGGYEQMTPEKQAPQAYRQATTARNTPPQRQAPQSPPVDFDDDIPF